MSARIEQIAEVISEVKERFRYREQNQSINDIRVKSCKSVAERRNITYQSVVDKFIRQLRPDVSSAKQFDDLLYDWLLNNSNELKDLVSKHKSDFSDRDLLSSLFASSPEQDVLLSEEFGLNPTDSEFTEGKIKLRIHLIKERNRYLVKAAKEKWSHDSGGNIPCIVCGFSFFDKYGSLGKGFIEAHHLTPISQLTSDTIVKISELAPVCSNCHRMIHQSRPWLTINELKSVISPIK